MRAAAELVKSQVYLYRAALERADRRAAEKASTRLEKALVATDRDLLATGVPLSLHGHDLVRGRPGGVDPDELAPLTARIYLRHRVDGQVNYFRRASRLRRRREGIFLAGAATAAGLAALAAGTTFTGWASFLLLAVASIGVIRLRHQTRDQLASFDRAVAEIDSQRRRWAMLPGALHKLVDGVERALSKQGTGWLDSVERGANQATEYGHGL